MTSLAPTVYDQALRKAVLGNTGALSRLATQGLDSDSLARFGATLASESLGVQAQKTALSQISTALAPGITKIVSPDIAKIAPGTASLPALAPTFGRGIAPDFSRVVASIQKGLIGPLNFPKIERPELLRLRPMPPRAAAAAQVLPALVHEEAVRPDQDVVEWVRSLPLATRRELVVVLGQLTAIVLLAGAVFDRSYLTPAGHLVQLVTACYALYCLVLNENERRAQNDS